MQQNKFQKFIDLHQDLLAHILYREKYSQNRQTDFEMIAECGPQITVATAFPEPVDGDYLSDATNDLIEKDLMGYAEKCKSGIWKMIKTRDDIDAVLTDEKSRGLLLHVEGLNTMSDTNLCWTRLMRWYTIGLRSVGIVWNVTNSLGGGTKDFETDLTPLGATVVRWLLAHQMVVDLAHANGPTWWSIAKIVRGAGRPLYISHGNCCALCANPRNYTDEQLRAVAESDGVVGAFFAKTFVTGRDLSGSVIDITNHIDHLRSIMGIDCCAIGTDFGGIITGTLDGLSSLQDMQNVWNELRHRGYSEDDIEKIAYKNAARVLKKYL